MKKIIYLVLFIVLFISAFAENAILNLKVTGMHCGGCEMKFKTEAAKIKGIEDVNEVSAEKGTASILYDPEVITAEKAIQSLAENTGYTITATTSIGVVQVEGKPTSCCMMGQKSGACQKNTKSSKSEKSCNKKE
jgi:copper chaperone CopZ